MAEKKQRYITPRGVAVFCMVNQPSVKFKKEGEYTIKLAFTAEEAQPLIELLKPLLTEAVEEQKKTLKPAAKKTLKIAEPWSVELDEETGDETGRLLFNFKMLAKVTSKKTGDIIELKPDLFDSRGNRIKPGSVKIGSGSECKVAFTTRGYYMASDNKAGLTLDLQAVQVLRLVEWTGGMSAEAYGFEEEEGFDSSEFSTEEGGSEEGDF